MGVIYKLKPEIIEFVVEQKKLDKNLSCRKIAALVQDKFKFKLSKSSANSILKQSGLSMPAGRRPSPEPKKALPELKKVSPELKKAPSEKPVTPLRCIKAGLLDGSSFYLDGQGYTLWHSAAQIPVGFSSNAMGSELNSDPIVLFFARGYDSPTEELFKFILSFYSPQMRISQLILYDKELQEMEKIDVSIPPGHFIFGVWPWQFKEYITVRLATEFLPFHFATKNRDFYIAEAEVELASPKKEGSVVKLRGAALYQNGAKKGTVLTENHPLILLSNFTAQEINLTQLATLYLERWPNLEVTLRDFSNKIEEFIKRGL